ncbi:hypothetical protein XU18_4678 [Perkinsela sp. CCAP 1560/4]|nr:hypothetical protein XU18_4678 [Perkinsela sp. CCAP 1560/4]|eukprot:KNH04008.1 hypothetical protein XU18_4678 [Perkinsela sp. CCAP 1560/4]
MLARSLLRRIDPIRSLFDTLKKQKTPLGAAEALVELKLAEQTTAQTDVLQDLQAEETVVESIQSIRHAENHTTAHRDGIFAGLKLCTNLFLRSIETDRPRDLGVSSFVTAVYRILLENHKSDGPLTRCALHALFHHCMVSAEGLTHFVDELAGEMVMHCIAREYSAKLAKAKEAFDGRFDPTCPAFTVPAETVEIIDHALSVLLLSITRAVENIAVSEDRKLRAIHTALHCLDTLSECAVGPALQHKIWEFVSYGCSGSLQQCGEVARWFTYQRVGSVIQTLREAVKLENTTAQEMFVQCFFHVFAVFTGDRLGMALDESRAKGLADTISLSGLPADALAILRGGHYTQPETLCNLLGFLVNISANEPSVRTIHGVETVVRVMERQPDAIVLEKATQLLWNVLNHPDGVTACKDLGCEWRIRQAISSGKFAEFTKKLDVLFGEPKPHIAA